MRSTALIAVIIGALVLTPSAVKADSFPVSFSAKGGIGQGYFSMSELNSQIASMRQYYDANLSELKNGFNVYLEGRIWFFGRFAALAGFEHYWAENTMDTGEFTLTYKAPTSVFLLGGVMTVFTVPKLVDLNIGVRGSLAKAIYGTNEFTESDYVSEYKNNGYGWDIFAEVNTNFIRPVEVGLMLGYRGLKVKDLKNKFDETATFIHSDDSVVLDYSGIFFYLTAGVRLW
jgi:hypothetical protein